MNNDFEIRSPRFPSDMSTWCAEKSSNIGEDVSQALDLVSKCDSLDSHTKEMLQLHLSSSLYDISKLMSFSTGEKWSVADARDIQDHGYEGYQRIAVKYGILRETDTEAKRSRVEGFCNALSKLLWGQRSPNRTYVHDLVISATNGNPTLDHPIVEKTAQNIELVTQGELEWKEFCRIMDAEVRGLKIEGAIQLS